MAIVHVGTLRLQVREKGTRREFVERLIDQIEEQVRQVVTWCIEEALEGEVDTLLKRGWYKRRKPKRRRGSRALQAMRVAGPAGLSSGWALPALPGHELGTAADQRAAARVYLRGLGADAVQDTADAATDLG
jgi:hypothetical protein